MSDESAIHVEFRPESRLLSRIVPWAIAGLYVLLYVTLDWISYVQPILKLGITPWSPQAGLTLAFLLWNGHRWAPATALAAFLSELLVRDAPASLPMLALAAAWVALVYGVLAAQLGRASMREAMQALAPAVRFVLAALAASLLAALGYVGCFLLAESLPWASVPGSVLRYLVGDLNGILMLTPLLLALPRRGVALRALRDGWIQAAAQLGLLMLFVWLLFGLDASDRLRFFYPLFVPVIWIAVRWGAIGALSAALAIQVGIVVAMSDAPTGAPLIDLQILMLTLAITGLLLGAVVAERARALQRLAAGEAELRAVLAAAPDAVITTDADGMVRTGNQAAVQLFGFDSERAPQVPLQQLLPELRPALGAASGRRTVTAVRHDEGRFPADVAWVRIEPPARPGWLVLVRDATGRMKIQSEAQERDRALSRAMRFAVAGEMASALAHELNQPITALVSYLHASQIMSGSDGGSDRRLSDTLAKAANEAIRASQVLRRLRDFYQGAAPGPGPAEPAACCATVAELIEPRLQRQGVRLLVDLPEDMPLLQADRSQVEMVLHNLVTNAVDALAAPGATRREVLITGTRVDGRASVSVHDSGPGVSEDALQQLFEPFNTTKADGMGLGLAISRNLIRAQGGELAYRRSERLGGACFEIVLDLFPSG